MDARAGRRGARTLTSWPSLQTDLRNAGERAEPARFEKSAILS